MGVAGNRVAALAAQELVDRHAGLLALDVPERDVDPGQRDVVDRAGPPVPARERRLPDVLDLAGVPPDQPRRDPLLDHRDDRAGRVVLVRRADPVQPRLVGQHLDEDPVAARARLNRLDPGDFGHRARPQAPGRLHQSTRTPGRIA